MTDDERDVWVEELVARHAKVWALVARRFRENRLLEVGTVLVVHPTSEQHAELVAAGGFAGTINLGADGHAVLTEHEGAAQMAGALWPNLADELVRSQPTDLPLVVFHNEGIALVFVEVKR
jgi:hypothetical protein